MSIESRALVHKIELKLSELKRFINKEKILVPIDEEEDFDRFMDLLDNSKNNSISIYSG